MRIVMASTLAMMISAAAVADPVCSPDLAKIGQLKPGVCSPVDGDVASKVSKPKRCADGRFSLDGAYRQWASGDPKPHKGLDLLADALSPVYAAQKGIVLGFRDWSDGPLGLEVFLEHGDKSVSRYVHLDSVDTIIFDGLVEIVEVEAGQQIALSGTSGNAEGGCPHLHLQIHKLAFPPSGDVLQYTFSERVLDPLIWLLEEQQFVQSSEPAAAGKSE